MKKAKERQITFYADPDIYEWLKKQESVTRSLNAMIRSAMNNQAENARPSGSPAADAQSSKGVGLPPELSSSHALGSMVNELEQIQEAILKSYRRQQAMIGALRTHQSLFEKSATLYRELGRIKDDEDIDMEPANEVVEVASTYNELLINSADTIKSIIASSEEDSLVITQTGGIRERLIAAIETGEQTSRRDVDAPARSFSLKVRKLS